MTGQTKAIDFLISTDGFSVVIQAATKAALDALTSIPVGVLSDGVAMVSDSDADTAFAFIDERGFTSRLMG